MHDLIQDMGQEVVKQDASSKLGQYSRLWNHEDIINVLTTNSESDSIQLISCCPNVPVKKLEKLTYVDFSHSKQLTQIPDVSGSINITTLELEGCTNLRGVHDSVGVLPKILDLSLEGCTNLEIFPRGIKMTSLESLNLNYCKSLQYFPEILGQMDRLRRIRAQWTGIKQIPHSICYLSGLEFLFISNNDELVSLPESIRQLDALIHLYMENCKKLRHISGVPPNIKRIRADGCMSLSPQSLSILWSQALQERVFSEVVMPKTASHCKTVIPNWFERNCKTEIPNWFDCQSKGGSISFHFLGNLLFFAWAVVIGKSTDEISSKSNGTMVQLICKVDGCEIVDKHCEYYIKEGGILLTIGYIRLSECVSYKNVYYRDWHHAEMECKSGSLDQEVDECGVLFVYKKPNMKMEDIQFEYPFPNEGSMPRNDEKIDKAKAGKFSIMTRNDKDLEAYKLPRRFFKDSARVGIRTCWRRQALPTLFFSKYFKLSPSFLSI
ncbi:hypothetical protein L6164_000888 [Bauhinia variegata]|uniref:Uncharacterized protein n=1 Tax=Bauhinia variegata TaxID=167791 RepID=A0ACB9Q7V4_BAUVA|nr:hypothetical protein L6164_000888 [Bauhinia variegata]